MDEPSILLADTGLTPGLTAGAAAAGWVQATPVQAAAIPIVLSGRDLLAVAPTGSGKTAAYVLPLMQRLLAVPGLREERPRRLRALVLTPTRELAAQVEAAVRALAPDLKTVVAIGGLSINPQMMALRGGAHVVLATPGRLLDLIDHGALQLSTVEMVVLDEADRLLDLGFAAELQRLLTLLPAQRQTLLLSATMPAPVAALARKLLSNPQELHIGQEPGPSTPDIAQRVFVVDSGRRTALLRQLLRTEGWTRVLVFVASQYASEHVADKLRQAGVAAAALSGRLSQGRRRQVLRDLAQGAVNVLVSTDLAARGIDLKGLEVVVNHDLPRSAVDHVHRIGRTGRAGATGLAISFVCADLPTSEAHFRLIEKRQGHRIVREQLPGFEPVAPVDAALAADPTSGGLDPHGGIKGQRKSKKDKLREAAAQAARRR